MSVSAPLPLIVLGSPNLALDQRQTSTASY
jgi:hypothetical protein